MIFLHGGGDSPNSRIDTFGRFVEAATTNSSCNLALIVAEDTEVQARESFDEYCEIFTSLPIAPTKIYPILVSPTQPLTRSQLESIQPSGIFVCGGSTPLYHQSICLDTTWVSYLQATKIPYGGTSAGASIAANKSILGGWQVARKGEARAILFQGASEGLDPLTVDNGLNLVPFSIDAHASQMGTLTRLIHAVETGMVSGGWAIDENTLLHFNEGAIVVYGQGHCYRVWRNVNQSVGIEIYTA